MSEIRTQLCCSKICYFNTAINRILPYVLERLFHPVLLSTSFCYIVPRQTSFTSPYLKTNMPTPITTLKAIIF